MKRPPKKWWKSCTKGVRASGSATDPEKVCGSEWYHKMSKSQKKSAVAAESVVESEAVLTVVEPAPSAVEDVWGIGKVMELVTKHWNETLSAAKKRCTCGSDSFWGFMVGNAAQTVEERRSVIRAGVPATVVCEADEQKADTSKAVYKTLFIKRKDGKEETVPVTEVAKLLAPYAKNFKSPMEALVRGNPDSVLKVVQHVWGKDVTNWWIPAETEALLLPLRAAMVTEAYHVSRHGNASPLFEAHGMRIRCKPGAAKTVAEAFDKSNVDYLKKLFPNVWWGYVEFSTIRESLKRLIGEVATPVDEMSKEVVDRYFPHINTEYLKHIKESKGYGGGGLLAYFDQRLHDEAAGIPLNEV